MDVYTSAEVPFMTAVLGGEIIVPTLYGNVSCKITEGTRCGSQDPSCRQRYCFYERSKDQRRPVCDYPDRCSPQNLTEDAKRKLKEFTDACKTEPHAA